MKKFLCALLLLALSAGARADFNEGVVAYLTGDYDKAYATMRSLAETTDHAYAQYYVGMMFLKGQGVPQSYEEAGTWFLKAAQQRIPQAQFQLGTLYLNGQGLPRDLEQAYAWFAVGAAHNHQKAKAGLESARSRLSAEELAEAGKLSEKLVEQYGPDPKAAGSDGRNPAPE
jgi:hypothetical protein